MFNTSSYFVFKEIIIEKPEIYIQILPNSLAYISYQIHKIHVNEKKMFEQGVLNHMHKTSVPNLTYFKIHTETKQEYPLVEAMMLELQINKALII